MNTGSRLWPRWTTWTGTPGRKNLGILGMPVLGSHKFKQWFMTVMVGVTKSINIGLSRCIGINQALMSPCEARATECHQKQVCRCTGMPPVSIWK